MWQFQMLDPGLKFPSPILTIMDKPMDLGGRIPPVKANRIMLKDVLDADAYRGGKIVYTYDFGDRWEHKIQLIGRTNNATDFVVCIDGEGHPAHEDIGGTCGWGELQRAHLAPAAVGSGERAEQEELLARYQDDCANGAAMGQTGLRGDGFWRWDINEVNRKLIRMPERDCTVSSEDEESVITTGGTT